MKEIWKDIKGYEGLYQISNYGKVKSFYMGKEKIKVPAKCRGYLKIDLHKDKQYKRFFIHRLVAQEFIPNPNNLPCVNHKDCNKANNVVTNLEWITNKDNNNYKNHQLKANISAVLFYLRKQYPNRFDLINDVEKIRKTILEL